MDMIKFENLEQGGPNFTAKGMAIPQPAPSTEGVILEVIDGDVVSI